MNRVKKILLVDDDELLRDALIDQFGVHDEFAVEPVANANAAIERAKEEAHIDLMLLDVGLPDMDGREACRIMRKNGFKSPIIMLTVQLHQRIRQLSENLARTPPVIHPGGLAPVTCIDPTQNQMIPDRQTRSFQHIPCRMMRVQMKFGSHFALRSALPDKFGTAAPTQNKPK